MSLRTRRRRRAAMVCKAKYGMTPNSERRIMRAVNRMLAGMAFISRTSDRLVEVFKRDGA